MKKQQIRRQQIRAAACVKAFEGVSDTEIVAVVMAGGLKSILDPRAKETIEIEQNYSQAPCTPGCPVCNLG